MGTIVILLLLSSPLFAAEPKADTKQQTASFRRVNRLPEGKYPGLLHATFDSESNGEKVAYCIYLPPGYDDAKNQDRRDPVVYWLHGGRPGGETKGISVMPYIDEAMKSGDVPPMIYVFPNGSAVSHYDSPKLKSLGETAFADSEELALRSGTTLIEVGNDHRLADPEPLERMLRACEGN